MGKEQGEAGVEGPDQGEIDASRLSRKAPNLTIKLAAALLQINDDTGQPLIEWDHAKLMSAEQINSLFQWDHYPIRHEAGGPTEPWNLVPRFIPAHRTKTAKIDMPEIAKIKRISKAEEDFRNRMLSKSFAEDFPNTWGKRKSKWPKRPIRSK